MALAAEEGAEKLYKLLYGCDPPAAIRPHEKIGRGLASPRQAPIQAETRNEMRVRGRAPEKPKPTGPARKVAIIGIATEEELRERTRLAAEKKAQVEKRTVRKRSKSYRGPKTVICPCGVPFEVPGHAVKYHSDECRAKYRVRMYSFTPEMDEQVREAYRNRVGMGRGQIVKPLAEQLGLPRWRVSKRALELGLVSKVAPCQYPQTRSWTDAERQIVVKYASATLTHIGRKLREAGFCRSENAIKIFILRHIGPKPKEDYSACRLAKLMGIDGHAVIRWIREGWLKGTAMGTARSDRQGGDIWVVRPEDAREFIIGHLAMIDLRKVDKFWFVELLTGREAPV